MTTFWAILRAVRRRLEVRRQKMALDRQAMVYRNFRGVDVRKQSLFSTGVPQDLVEQGLLLDAKGIRFTRGRAVWQRNRLKVKNPATVTLAWKTMTVQWQRVSNVVTLTTLDVSGSRFSENGFAVGNRVTVTGAGAGTFTTTGGTGVLTLTYADAGADAGPSSVTLTGERMNVAVPFVTEDYDQLLMMSDHGYLYSMPVDWTDTPTQWAYGYELFAGETWTQQSAALPATVAGVTGIALMNDLLFLAAGADAVNLYGWVTRFWNGAALAEVGLATPTTKPSATVDGTTAANELVEGRYSYQVVFGNEYGQSMPGPVLDVDCEDVGSSGYIQAVNILTAPNHGDTVTIGANVYTFVTEAGLTAAGDELGAGDVLPRHATSARTWSSFVRYLAGMITNGATQTYNGVSVYTERHPDVTAELTWTGTTWRVVLTAREEGAAGTTIVLSESSGAARTSVSGATLTGGKGPHSINLTAIPTGPTGTTWRRLYRAFSASLADGARGDEFNAHAVIPDNSTTTYADNTPQDELGEPVVFDHARPHRGSLLLAHRDRLWMAGVVQTSDSYNYTPSGAYTINTAPLGAVRAANVVTIQTASSPGVPAAHGLKPGDWIKVSGIVSAADDFNGTFRVATVPTANTFTYAQTGANETNSSGNGTIGYGFDLSGQGNRLYFSEAGLPQYWPIENQITVGGVADIVALATWRDQLLVIKADSVYLLTGYGESDWRLEQVPGATGAIGPHVATSPYGVVWAGHGGWEIFDGAVARTLLPYSGKSFARPTSYDSMIEAGPPTDYYSDAAVAWPAAAYHDEHFYLAQGGGWLFRWHPATDTWQVRIERAQQVGLRTCHYSLQHAHVLTGMVWGPGEQSLPNDFSPYLTVLDSTYDFLADYGDDVGTQANMDLQHVLGLVDLRFPPIVGEPGSVIEPLELWIEGQWTVPVAAGNDLKLYIGANVDTLAAAVGTVTAGKRIHIPAGNAAERLEMRLLGTYCRDFALQAVTVHYQTRPARGA